jgi:N-acetylglucosaminyl-diphospho-decaprenol L-rhamnosyltransferase
VISTSVIIPTALGGDRLVRVLGSLEPRAGDIEVLVVDNDSGDLGLRDLRARFEGVEVIELDRNVGYSKAINLAARQARGRALVLLNDDCVCDPGYSRAIIAPLNPGAGITMAAGVMRDPRDPARIDTAGVALDRTLLGFDYLNGEPMSTIEGDVADPLGPSGAAAAFDREAFLAVGGFDETLFAYWEDVDLVLRMRLGGGSCALARAATGLHEHSATLGSGSRRKNYLMGFGRGYVLRKWGVLRNPQRLVQVLIADGTICIGQGIIDRNVCGLRGRIRGFRAGAPSRGYPTHALPEDMVSRSPRSTLAKRLRRRRRLAGSRRTPST